MNGSLLAYALDQQGGITHTRFGVELSHHAYGVSSYDEAAGYTIHVVRKNVVIQVKFRLLTLVSADFAQAGQYVVLTRRC